MQTPPFQAVALVLNQHIIEDNDFEEGHGCSNSFDEYY